MLVQQYGLIGVAMGTAFTQIMFFGIFTPILTSKVINSSLVDYFKRTYLRILPSSILLFVLLKYFSSVKVPESYSVLLLQALGAALIYLISVYFILLDKDEKVAVSAGMGKVLAKVQRR